MYEILMQHECGHKLIYSYYNVLRSHLLQYSDSYASALQVCMSSYSINYYTQPNMYNIGIKEIRICMHKGKENIYIK